ncbi:MAG: magnesium transporter [Proteobacteria bacterium]|nr:MAG: magnesium transporter [Pseudomonadota bacterium]
MVQPRKSRLLHDTIRRYLRRQAWSHLDKLIAKTRVEDLAAVMAAMAERDRVAIFGRLEDNADRANLICAMSPPFGKTVLDPLPADKVVGILREMAQDDMADILADLEPELAARVLEILEESDEVEDLMAYGDDTAGGIMLPEFVAIDADQTAEEALIALRESGEDVEMVYYIYAVNEHGHLVGVLSLRKLVVAPAHKRIREIMETDVISVSTETDQERVAHMVAEYDLLAIPVVDDANKLLGLVTVDDVIDVLQEEAEEDFRKMAGAGEYVPAEASVFRHVAIRFPWLLASAAGGLIAAAVMGNYEETLEAQSFLALFLPVILGMSGNVGTQSATVTVRGIAMGHIHHGERAWATVRKEIGISISMGALYGSAIGVIAYLTGDQPHYGPAIGLSIAAGMIIASTIGTVIPILLSRLNIDPAVATGPIVTTSVDFFGVMTYFGIATYLAVAMGATV